MGLEFSMKWPSLQLWKLEASIESIESGAIQAPSLVTHPALVVTYFITPSTGWTPENGYTMVHGTPVFYRVLSHFLRYLG